MIRMTRMTDYAIVILQSFAGRPEHTQLSARDLAEFTKLPLPTVSKVLKVLAKKGFLKSNRGANGGYGLSKKPTDISVAEIIGALEGPIAVTDCSVEHGACDQESTCHVRSHWQLINHAIQKALEDIDLSTMAAKAPPQLTPIPMWTER